MTSISCDKDFNIDKDWADKSLEKSECYDIIYPLTYNMPDGTSIEISNGDDCDAIKAWYEATESKDKPVLIYPVQVRKDEALLTLENDDEFEAWKKDNC